MHLKSHVIMKLALGLTVSASISACQKSRRTIESVPDREACEGSSVLPEPDPHFKSEVPQDDAAPVVITVDEPEEVGVGPPHPQWLVGSMAWLLLVAKPLRTTT